MAYSPPSQRITMASNWHHSKSIGGELRNGDGPVPSLIYGTEGHRAAAIESELGRVVAAPLIDLAQTAGSVNGDIWCYR